MMRWCTQAIVVKAFYKVYSTGINYEKVEQRKNRSEKKEIQNRR